MSRLRKLWAAVAAFFRRDVDVDRLASLRASVLALGSDLHPVTVLPDLFIRPLTIAEVEGLMEVGANWRLVLLHMTLCDAGRRQLFGLDELAEIRDLTPATFQVLLEQATTANGIAIKAPVPSADDDDAMPDAGQPDVGQVGMEQAAKN